MEMSFLMSFICVGACCKGKAVTQQEFRSLSFWIAFEYLSNIRIFVSLGKSGKRTLERYPLYSVVWNNSVQGTLWYFYQTFPYTFLYLWQTINKRPGFTFYLAVGCYCTFRYINIEILYYRPIRFSTGWSGYNSAWYRSFTENIHPVWWAVKYSSWNGR